MKRLQLLLLGLLLILHACKPKYAADEIPSYISVGNSNRFVNNYFAKDSSRKIYDTWLTVNGQFLGTYQNPSLMPVLGVGSSKVTVYAGIKENGISSTRAIYPFYTAFDTTVTLVQTKIISITPRFKYQSNVIFNLFESFEGSKWKFATVGNYSQIDTSTDVDGTLAQGRCLTSKLSPGRDTFFMYTPSIFDKEAIGKSHWVEVSFKSDIVIHFGVFVIDVTAGIVSQVPYLDLRQTDGVWNKVYINLTTLIAEYGTNKAYLLYFSAERNGSAENRVYLDNIKLVDFE